MRPVRAWFLRFAGLFQQKRSERELAEELESHLQMHVDDNLRRGMTPEEARRQARIDLGGLEQAKEGYRERRGLPALDRAAQDARYAMRVLRKNPGFAAVVVLTLGLGIGANTAIFSVVNAVLLRPLPYPEPDRIVKVWHTPPPASFPGVTRFSLSPANYLDWRSQNHAFERIAAYSDLSLSLTSGDRPEAIVAAVAAPDLFAVLGARPLLGRTFNEEEDAPGQGKVVVLGHRLWQTRFGGDTGVVGKQIRLSGESYTVIGVMPAGFRFPEEVELWLPLAWSTEERAVRGIHDYRSVARLRPGVSVAQAQAELSAIAARLAEQYPDDNKGWGALVVPLRDDVVGEVEPALLVLLGAVCFVLLIACANVANLVLARTLARRKEIAVRAALGASRGRVLQQVLSENLILALAGGVLGVLLAIYGVEGIVAFLGDRLPRYAEVSIDGRVLLFALVLSIFTGLVAGIIPAVRLTRVDLAEALKQGTSKTTSDSGGNRTRSALVVAEVALSLVLLVGAGLMIRTLGMLRNVNPGFDPGGVLSMTVALPAAKYPTPVEQNAFFERTLQRVRTLPGVVSAGAVSSLPLSGGGSTQPVAIEGHPVVAMSEQPEVAVRAVTPGYLATMRIPVLRGRDFDQSDVPGRPDVVLVSETMAKRFWPGEDPIGKRLVLTFLPGVTRQVVGIVGDVKQDGLDSARPPSTLYVPQAQVTRQWLSLVIRAAPALSVSVPAVTGAIREIDAEQPVLDVMTLDRLLESSLAHQRLSMLLLAAFAGFALLLAAMGIYSVLSYAVRRRMQEIGIRVALGAQRSDVLWMVLGHGLRLTAAGLAIGTAAALGLTQLIAGLLFGVPPGDPVTFVAVSLLLCAIALLACYLPARRAMRVDPMVTLRYE